MGVIFTQEAEKRRLAAMRERNAKKPKWELLKTFSLVEATHFARDHGWGDKKVQVKAYRINDEEFEYAVEPFEQGCRCPNLLKYEEYFDGGENTE
jgi:hypothetical protein